MNRIWGLAIGLGLAVLPCGAWNAAPQSDSAVRRILVLSSFHNRHPWTAAFLENMHRAIQQRRDVVITDFVELHSARLRDEGFEDRFNLCLPLIRAGKYDAVVAILDDAVNLTLQSCNLFPPAQPVLLGGLRVMPPGVKEQYPNVTGVVTGCGNLASLRIGLALLPDSKNAAFIADGPPRGTGCRRELPKQLAALPGLQMNFLFGQELSTRQMLERAAQLPPDTVVIFDSWRVFGRDGYLLPEVVGDQLYRALRRPYMTVDDAMFGHGALGGYVMRGSSQGKAAGALLNRILDGEPLPRIDFAHCPPELMIDGALAAWYGIAPGKLPPGTIFWRREEQGWHVPADGLTVAGVVLLMLAAGVGAWFCCRHKFGGRRKNALAAGDSAARSWRGLPCADAETVKRAITEVFGAGSLRRTELEFGECRHLAALLRLDPAVFGQEGLLCISQDISGQHDTMHRRRLLEQRNHAVLQAIADALAVIDAEGRVIFMNAAAERLAGCAAGTARGQRLEAIFRLGGESVERLVAATIASGEVSGPVYEGKLSVPGGALIPVGCCCAPIDDGGKVIGAVLLLRDLSGNPDNLPLLRQGMEKMRLGEFSFFRYVPATSGVTPFAAGSFRFRPLREDGTAVPLNEWFTANSRERIRRQIKKICAGENAFFTCPVDSCYRGIERSYLASVWRPGGCARPTFADSELFGMMQDVTGLLNQERAYHENLVLLRTVAEELPFPVFTAEEEDEFRYLARNRGGGREWNEDDGERERMFRANHEALLEAGREMIEFADRYREPDSGRYGGSTFVRLISLVDGTQLLLGVCVGVSREELASRSDAKVAPVVRRILDGLPPDVLNQGIDEQIRLRLWSCSYARQTGLPEVPGAPEACGMAPVPQTVPAECSSPLALCGEVRCGPDAAVRARRIACGKHYLENRKVLERSLNAVTIARQFETSVRELLSVAGRAVGADRAYFYRFTGNGIQLGFEWNRNAGKPAEGMALDSVSPGLTSYFGEHELLRIESVDDPNSPMADCTPVLKVANINGLLLHRVIYDGALYGFVGVTMRGGAVRFRAADIAAVSDAAHLFVQARQRRDQMEQLSASARQRKMIFEKMATPAVIFDKNLRVVSINGECLRLLDANEDVVGNFCGALHCGAEDSACCATQGCPVWRTLETLAPQAQSYLRDGRMLMRRTQPIFDTDGQLVSVVESVVEQSDDVAVQREADERQQEDLAIYSRELRLYVAQDRAVNLCMEVLAQDNGFYDALQQLTAKVGHELALEDCVLFHFDAEDGGTLLACESWYAPVDTGKPPVRFVFRKEFPAFFRELETFGQAAFHWDAIRRQPTMLPYQEEMRRYREGDDHFDAFCSSVFRAGKFWGVIGAEVCDGRHTLNGEGERMMNTAARVVEVLLEQEESRKARLYVERENQALLELLPTAVLLLDGEMNIENINSAAAEIIGVPPAVAASVQFGGLCPVCRSGGHCAAELALETGAAQSCEQMVCGRLYLVNALPVEAPLRDGKVLISLVELPENRAQLLESVRKATDAARAKSFFLATLNRELRLPASLPEPLESQSGASREPAWRIATDLLSMLSRLLELSALEAEQMRFAPHETDFDRQLEEVRAMIRPLAEARRLAFSLRGPSHPPLLMVDVKRIRQVLLQLLNNAVKFTETGSIVLAWEFERSDSEYGTLTIRLTDTGCGIAPENQARIFESFVRLNLSADDEEGGGQTVGLGLPIASRLVQCMEGALTVESAVGCGSTFIVTLPEVHYREQDRADGDVAAPSGTKPGRNILLVDDTAINLRVFSALLRRFGCECRCAASGAEALAQLRYFRPDWVFCDSRMPGMDGAEVAEAIRAVPEWNAIHLAVMVAESESERKLDTGLFDAVLRKPLTAAALGEMLRG